MTTDDEDTPQQPRKDLTPAEFTRQMPDEEYGAGPGAPEDLEPVKGGPGDGSTRPGGALWKDSDANPEPADEPDDDSA